MTKLDKKLLGGWLIAVLLVSTIFVSIANAGILDDLKTAIDGHIKDAKSRLDDSPREIIKIKNVLYAGEIDEDAKGQDFIHNSKGGVSIITGEDGYTYLVLTHTFKSSPGPDYHVYLSYKKAIVDESGFNKEDFVEIAPLKYGNGLQFYKLPYDIDLVNVKSFLLWCKAFGAYIGSANLTTPHL